MNNDGVVSKSEIKRALNLFNLDLTDDRIDILMKECDEDGDGKVGYDEFVDALVRDTVAPDAMKKRGMQSKDAMGVDAYAALDQQIHGQKVRVCVRACRCACRVGVRVCGSEGRGEESRVGGPTAALSRLDLCTTT